MHITQLRIRNFRNFRAAKFGFKKGVNTLIGENGSGKTNAFFALRILLDDSLTRNAAQLKSSDFCRAVTPSWRGQWIIIAIDFDDLDPSEGCQILKHRSGHMDESETGTYTFFYRPKHEFRKKLFELSIDKSSNDEIESYLAGITTDDYEAVYSGRATLDVLDDGEYASVAGDFNSLCFPDPDDDDQAILGVRTNILLHSEITCTFVQALRDAVSDLRGYKNNPLLALLRGLESTIDPKDSQRITDAVAGLNSDIASLEEIREIALGVQKTLHATVGHTFSPAISVESMLPDQLDKLLQRLAITVGDDINVDYRGDISELSLGGANLIYLALKLLEYELKLSSDRVAHFLLIEEPEAHIHAHVQKTLFEAQSSHKTQVIVSTHSTHISSAAKISAVNILARCESEAVTFQPANGLDELTISRVERYLDAVRSTLLFAKGVVLVEGEAELVLVPALIRSVFGVSADELGISVISMNSAFFEHIAAIFDEARIRRRCSIITDKDKSLIALGDEPSDDSAAQRRARSSQVDGARRKEVLDKFSIGNAWVKPFYARHTFEVEFIRQNNSREVIGTLDNIFEQAAARNRSAAILASGDDVAAGTEILRLAKKAGKGWFALLVAETLEIDTVIPRYILKAIAFASAQNISASILRKMILFRVADELFPVELREKVRKGVDIQTLAPEDLVQKFSDAVPDDPVATLVKLIEKYK